MVKRPSLLRFVLEACQPFQTIFSPDHSKDRPLRHLSSASLGLSVCHLIIFNRRQRRLSAGDWDPMEELREKQFEITCIGCLLGSSVIKNVLRTRMREIDRFRLEKLRRSIFSQHRD